MCYCSAACVEPCKIVLAELRAKGIYDMDSSTGALVHKGKEIGIVFTYDPYSDKVIEPNDDE